MKRSDTIFDWEIIEEAVPIDGSSYSLIERAHVPNGWLVRSWSTNEGYDLAYIQDPNHAWKDKKLDG